MIKGENSLTIIAIIIAIAVIVLLFKILKTPIKWAWKLLIHAGVGVLMLWLTNILGGIFGLSLDITWLNSIVSGILGFPGVLLLLAIKYLF